MTFASHPGAMQPYALTLDRFIDHAAKWHGAREVVTGGSGGASTRIGYAALRERSQRLSGALRSLGLTQGDNLGVLAWNSQAQMECWYGAIGIGIVCHTLNPRLAPAHLAAMIAQAANRVLAISPDLAPLVEQLVPLCPTLEHVVVLDEPGVDVALPELDTRVWRYEALLAERGEALAWGGFDENAPAGLCFTSGTTGAPKGVTYTHRSNYLHTIHQLQGDASGLTSRDALLVAVPMFHANGWGFPFSGPAAGTKLVLPGRHQDGASLAALINAEGVTMAAGVPTVWLGLADHLDRTGGEVPSLERIMLGGSSVPQALMDRLEQRLGVTVQTSWGMTELSPLGTTTPATARVRSAAKSGRPPLGVDLLLTDAEGVALPDQRGPEGRLYVRGASVVERYFGHDAPAVDADGWFDTGDLAVIDADGNVSITGRAKDLIKSGGEWINPVEIEAIVGAMPGVAQVAVVGRVHAKWGERPVLVVEPCKGADLSDETILETLRTGVQTWWLPDAIVRVTAMPLAMTGKIDKKRLRAEHGGMQ